MLRTETGVVLGQESVGTFAPVRADQIETGAVDARRHEALVQIDADVGFERVARLTGAAVRSRLVGTLSVDARRILTLVHVLAHGIIGQIVARRTGTGERTQRVLARAAHARIPFTFVNICKLNFSVRKRAR